MTVSIEEFIKNLKPCPFCGSSDVEIKEYDNMAMYYVNGKKDKSFRVSCNTNDCHGSSDLGWFSTPELAAYYWNIRIDVAGEDMPQAPEDPIFD